MYDDLSLANNVITPTVLYFFFFFAPYYMFTLIFEPVMTHARVAQPYVNATMLKQIINKNLFNIELSVNEFFHTSPNTKCLNITTPIPKTFNQITCKFQNQIELQNLDG